MINKIILKMQISIKEKEAKEKKNEEKNSNSADSVYDDYLICRDSGSGRRSVGRDAVTRDSFRCAEK